ncbi:hypothetical protein JCM19053_1175 [Vibrio sp. JCM 19053]|nr:hypothetical protein JCM19053_1175 [Vibrio sp. JCM 19053]
MILSNSSHYQPIFTPKTCFNRYIDVLLQACTGQFRYLITQMPYFMRLRELNQKS